MLAKLGLAQISRYPSAKKLTGADLGRDVDISISAVQAVMASLRVSEHPNRLVTSPALDR